MDWKPLLHISNLLDDPLENNTGVDAKASTGVEEEDLLIEAHPPLSPHTRRQKSPFEDPFQLTRAYPAVTNYWQRADSREAQASVPKARPPSPHVRACAPFREEQAANDTPRWKVHAPPRKCRTASREGVRSGSREIAELNASVPQLTSTGSDAKASVCKGKGRSVNVTDLKPGGLQQCISPGAGDRVGTRESGQPKMQQISVDTPRVAVTRESTIEDSGIASAHLHRRSPRNPSFPARQSAATRLRLCFRGVLSAISRAFLTVGQSWRVNRFSLVVVCLGILVSTLAVRILVWHRTHVRLRSAGREAELHYDLSGNLYRFGLSRRLVLRARSMLPTIRLRGARTILDDLKDNRLRHLIFRGWFSRTQSLIPRSKGVQEISRESEGSEFKYMSSASDLHPRTGMTSDKGTHAHSKLLRDGSYAPVRDGTLPRVILRILSGASPLDPISSPEKIEVALSWRMGLGTLAAAICAVTRIGAGRAGRLPKGKGKGKGKDRTPPPPKGKGKGRDTVVQKESMRTDVAGSLTPRRLSASEAPLGRLIHLVRPAYDAPANSVFGGQKDGDDATNDLTFDPNLLKAMFTEEEGELARRRLRSWSRPKSVGVEVFTTFRAQNIGIVLGKVALPTDELAEIVVHFDVENPKLRIDDLEMISSILPNPQEKCQILAHGSSPQVLRDIERKVIPLCALRASQFRVMHMGLTHVETYESLLKRCKQIHRISEELRRSRRFKNLLRLVLNVSNFVNFGTTHASAGMQAFAIESLRYVAIFKVGSVSALHFLCFSMWTSDQTFLSMLLESVNGIHDVTHEREEDLESDVQKFEQEITYVCSHAQALSEDDPGRGRITMLASDLAREGAVLQEALASSLKSARELQSYLNVSEQNEKGPPPCEETFGHINHFLQQLQVAWRDIENHPERWQHLNLPNSMQFPARTRSLSADLRSPCCDPVSPTTSTSEASCSEVTGMFSESPRRTSQKARACSVAAANSSAKARQSSVTALRGPRRPAPVPPPISDAHPAFQVTSSATVLPEEQYDSLRRKRLACNNAIGGCQ